MVAIGPAISIDKIDERIDEEERDAGRPLRLKWPGMIRRFAAKGEDGPAGDIVLLRGGTREILDVGVLGPYSFDPGLGVGSWDLGHVRSANWLDLTVGERQALERLLQGPFWWGRFAQLKNQEELGTKINRLVKERRLVPPVEKRPRTEVFEPEHFVELVVETASSDSIDSEQLLETIGIAQNFSKGDGEYHRLEADSIAMVLVPLFKSLGVDVSRIRVEVPIGCLTDRDTPARRIDLVVFDDAGIMNPRLFVEVKRRWNGLDGARHQMDDYLALTNNPDLPNLITDGTEFELKNLPGYSAADQPDETWDISLQWLTRPSAASLAKIADYLATS